MKKQDFTTTIEVTQTPAQVFEAIQHPENWWPGKISGSAVKLNDAFNYQYEDLHYSTQKVVEMAPGKKVVWLVSDSNLNYVEDKREWAGTKIIFEISAKQGKTQLRFTHQGLHTEVECYDSCSHSWRQIVQQSLFNLITTGKGSALVLG